MTSLIEVNRAYYLIERMLEKSHPEGSEKGRPRIKRLTSGDVMFISADRTELTPNNKRLPSAIIISPLGRTLLTQNPDFLSGILNGTWSQQNPTGKDNIMVSSYSRIRITTANLNNQPKLLVVKYHDEGDNCYPHARSEETPLAHDRVSGIDNFLSLRAISLFAPGLSVPEPIFATRRIFVAPFIEGQLVKSVPNWVRRNVSTALNKAYQLGWLQKPGRKCLFISTGFDIDLKTNGNMLEVNGSYSVIDPIS